MTKRIVYRRPDGGVSVCVPNPAAQRKGESNDQFLARVIVKDVPADATDVRIVNVEDLPPDRSFRDAWSMDNGQVGIDMTAAREVHRNRLRAARKPMLEALDVEAMRSLSNPDRLQEIEARKQALRDCTHDPAIEAAASPAVLATVWPLDTPNPVPLPTLDMRQPPPAGEPAGWSMADLLKRAAEQPAHEPALSEMEPAPSGSHVALADTEPPPPPPVEEVLSDSVRRRTVKALLADAVAEASRRANDHQMRYELALQAKNGNVRAMEGFKDEAAARGITVESLAEQIVAERRARERRMLAVWAIEAHALAEIAAATGDAIDDIAALAASQIKQGE